MAQQSYTLTIAILLALATSALSEYTLSDFKTQLFKFSYPDDGITLPYYIKGLYNIDLGFDEDDILPLAFGDLNNDK